MMTLEQAISIFMSDNKVHWADSTYEYYARNLKFFVDFVVKNYNQDFLVNDITKSIINEYILYLRGKGKMDNHILKDYMNVSGKLSANTIRTYFRAVKVFFQYLYQNKHILVNPVLNVKLPRANNKQIVPLTNAIVSEIDTLYDLQTSLGLRNYIIFHLMLDCGLRSMEVINLKVKDIMPDNNVILIRNSKGNKSRIVPLPDELKTYIERYVELRKPTEYLLLKHRSRKQITPDVFRSYFRVINSELHLNVYPHLLRHTFATSYILGGGDLESLRILLGHYDYNVTRIYLHLSAQFKFMKSDIYQLDTIFFHSGY